jgi:hypothetical protein
MGQLTQDGFEIHMGVNYIGYPVCCAMCRACRVVCRLRSRRVPQRASSRHFLLTNLLLEELNTTATKRYRPDSSQPLYQFIILFNFGFLRLSGSQR